MRAHNRRPLVRASPTKAAPGNVRKIGRRNAHSKSGLRARRAANSLANKWTLNPLYWLPIYLFALRMQLVVAWTDCGEVGVRLPLLAAAAAAAAKKKTKQKNWKAQLDPIFAREQCEHIAFATIIAANDTNRARKSKPSHCHRKDATECDCNGSVPSRALDRTSTQLSDPPHCSA